MPIIKISRLPEREVVSKVAGILPLLVPNLTVESEEINPQPFNEAKPDIAAVLRYNDFRKRVFIEVKSIGEPKMVEQAVTQLKRFSRSSPSSYLMFAAPYLSRRARELCREEGIGYLDLEGNVFVESGPILIDRTGNLERTLNNRNMRGIFAPKATRVIRELISRQPARARVTDLAKKCDMSPAGVYFVIRSLEEKGYVNRDVDKSIILREPRQLLIDWASNWSLEKNTINRFFSFETDSNTLGEKIAKAAKKLDVKYALTGLAGASKVAPYVRYDDVWLYVKGDVEGLVKELDLRPVTSGANVVILRPYDDGVFSGARALGNVQVVSDVQLFVDLYSYPARGREQAEMLMEKAIKFQEVA